MPYVTCPICEKIVYVYPFEKGGLNKMCIQKVRVTASIYCGHTEHEINEIFEKGESKMKKKDYVLEEVGKKFYLWSDLNADDLKKIEGVVNVYQGHSKGKHLVFEIHPRYDRDEVLNAVIFIAGKSDLLPEKLWTDSPFPREDIEQIVKSLLKDGQKTQAVKLVHKFTSWSLGKIKKYVEQY